MAVILFDSQFDEPAGVLRNNFGLRDHEKLEKLIADYSAARVIQLGKTPLIGNFDITHLRNIHRYIFQDVFPWAGDFREVTTSRTNSFGFPPPQFLIPSLETLFAALNAEQHLTALDSQNFVDRAAHYLGELNAIHPFREVMAAANESSFARSLSEQAIRFRGRT